MFYELYQANLDLIDPFRVVSRGFAGLLRTQVPPGMLGFVPRATAAALELFSEPPTRHQRPDFDIHQVRIGSDPVAIREEVVDSTPFCRLLHFRKEGVTGQPRLLLVAPLSGHFATLLRGTVRTLLPDHDVYITDWLNARDVPLSGGRFDFEDSVMHIIRFIEKLGPGTHVMAVCQPAVPVLAAVSLMAAENNVAQPQSMVLMGGPIDTRASPTQVSELAASRGIDWFERNLIHTVPWPNKGAFRRVYPGFLQLAAFLAMNPERHREAHFNQFNNLVKGDLDSAEAHRAFYREYTSVMDLPAEFYLDTIRTVFQNHDLPRGRMVVRGEIVTPAAIEKTALFTIEGELDDICAYGQTLVAHDLCTRLAPEKKRNHLQEGAGHYGIFNGRRWREQVYPMVKDFIKENNT
jgi:poly(3-hydroxybutyrate) depolymerase